MKSPQRVVYTGKIRFESEIIVSNSMTWRLFLFSGGALWIVLVTLFFVVLLQVFRSLHSRACIPRRSLCSAPAYVMTDHDDGQVSSSLASPANGRKWVMLMNKPCTWRFWAKIHGINQRRLLIGRNPSQMRFTFMFDIMSKLTCTHTHTPIHTNWTALEMVSVTDWAF